MIGLDQGGRARPHLEIIEPPASLRHYVKLLWIDLAPPTTLGSWRIVPDPNPCIVVPWRVGSRFPSRSVFVGSRSRYADGDRRGRALTCGLQFWPGALAPLVRISGRELADRAVPVDEIGGHGGIALHDLLASESDPQHVLEHLVAFVAALACASDPIDARVRGFTALSRRPRARLDALARELSVPDRTLRACLLNEVGLSPKRFLRIQRVLRAANLILHHRASAVEVAELTGFCDQPHMLREFGSLLGEAPRKFVARGQAG